MGFPFHPLHRNEFRSASPSRLALTLLLLFLLAALSPPTSSRACTVDPPAWTSFPPVEGYKVYSLGDSVDITGKVMQVPHVRLMDPPGPYAASYVWGRAGSYSWGSYWEWAFWDGCDIDWYATPGGAYYMASCTDFGARWGEDFQNGWDKWGVVTSDPSKFSLFGVDLCLPGAHQLTLSWQDKPKMGNWSVDGVDIENPATVDASGSANTTVNLVGVALTVTGHEAVGAYKLLRANAPSGYNQEEEVTCKVEATVVPSAAQIKNYHWTCANNLLIVENLSHEYISPSAQNISIIGLGPGAGNITCSVEFEKYPWQPGQTLSYSYSETINVYRATLSLYADKGALLSGDVGHSWWDLSINTGGIPVQVLIPDPNHRTVLGIAGYWPSENDPISLIDPESDPGQVILGPQGHPVTGEGTWGLYLSNLQAALDFTYILQQHPNTYHLYGNNCTTNAILAGQSAGIETIQPTYGVTPLDLSNNLNGL